MKLGKSLALMGMGAGAVLAYQKYNKPVMDKMEKIVDKTMKKANEKLEDMMYFVIFLRKTHIKGFVMKERKP